MSLTFIDTNKLPRKAIPGAGEVTEVLGKALCGANNVVGTLRWLANGEKLEAEALDKHQLIYVMDGAGSIDLDSKKHGMTKGMGVYLGPSEMATLEAPRGGSMKLFHLVVPKIPK